MRQRFVPAAWAVALSLGLVGLAGCSNTSSSLSTTPSITSFAASPAAIEAGSSSSITAVFANGAGVITPGNTAVTSGVAVSVSPTATTTYTLTVTPSSGSAITQAVTVTVDPVPVIASFVASPAAIEAGTNSSSSLTAMFTGGSGFINPGNISVTSGTAVSVSPTATTTYTLTVTPSVGAAITQTVTVTVDPAPVITSFVPSATTIEAGASVILTAVFTGGTGKINPGNISVTSGTAVSVTPPSTPTTTTYTLTVTPLTGAAVTSTVTVTVDPVPVITSFTANPATIASGESSSLTAVFTGGTGVITPGNTSVTSGVAVSVSPTATTTYSLTVTPPVGPAITQTATVTVSTAPVITSFTANPNPIEAGTSSSLTAVFTGGTGVISPGSLSVTSGTAVSVSPTTNTTYTLTVTPATGTAVTQNLTVTVDPAPTISSFVASPSTINAGQSTILTGVFAHGNGVITPGNLTAFSGTPITVSPTATTIYTLTVTPDVGPAISQATTVTVTPPPTSTITVNPATPGIAVTDHLLGMNLAAWYDVTSSTNEPAIQQGFATAGIKALRWPGGSWSDAYNWETNTECGNSANTDDDFKDVVNKLVVPAGLDLALTADYGTGKNCTGPGDPTEAAAWAADALTLGITVSHMTVGNEEYGSWEADNHPLKNNPATYAAAVVGASGYYDLIKAASPKTLVGVDVDEDNSDGGWDNTVMANAKGYYDFVEYHYYPQGPGSESDSFLLHNAPTELTNNINVIKAELAKWGTPNTPIYVGEMGSVYSNPGKQSMSITQGLFAGQVLGEMMNDGVVRATWWIGFGNCNGTNGSTSSLLYGWQDFGGYNIFADGPTDTGCAGAGPIGTLSPTARAYELFSQIAVNGENVLTPSVTGDTTDIRAYAATSSGRTALFIFNLNETISEPITIKLTGQSTATSVTQTYYDKAIYDQSNPATTDTWAPPTTNTLGAQSFPLSLTLTPWSMNVIIIK